MANVFLEQLSESLSSYTHKKLLKRGIDIRLNTGIARTNRDYIETDDGEKIRAPTAITIGSVPLNFINKAFELKRGKISINLTTCLQLNKSLFKLMMIKLRIFTVLV